VTDDVELADMPCRHACRGRGCGAMSRDLPAGSCVQHGDHLGRGAVLVLQTAEAQAGLQAEVISVCHVASFFWIKLIGGEGAAELLAVEG